MATKKISVFEQQLKREDTKVLKEIAQNKYKVYALNAQKAARNILEKRKN